MDEVKEQHKVETTALDYDSGSAELVAQKPLGFWGKVNNFLLLDSATEGVYSNHDLDPVPVAEQHWNMKDYALFWISDNLSVSGFRNAASVMEEGLSWKLALLCIALANIVQGVVVTINGMVGAKYHIPFSIQSRASYGYYLSYLMILMRCIVGIFWYGVQCYTGAECVQSMLYALWPSFRNVKNRLPESANITTQLMTAYVIYFLTCLPFHYVGVHRVKWLFMLKSITTPICAFAIMGWMVHQVGVGQTSLFTEGNTVKGSALAWTFVSSLNSNIGSGTTLMVNAPDYSRYARKKSDTFITMFAVPFTATVITVIGVIVAAGSKILYGEILWDPLEVINKWTSSGGRAAAFFCALSFYFSQVGLNIAANSLAAANDLNCIFPRYINIRRGQFIAALLGSWALTPWNILTSASGFLNFMGGYSIWLGPLLGILLSDYYFVHNRKYDIPELYNFNGRYRYMNGFNWRAFLAFFIGWVPLLPGFIPVIQGGSVTSEGISHLYEVGYFYGTGSAMLSYYVLCRFFPQEETYIEQGVWATESVFPDGIMSEEFEVEAGAAMGNMGKV
ncbi:hypothetical protein BZA70DRAFT_150547 [Myxozyma melibiosi]|uniref:Allantoin permease n=1 Tax=Myxozyma melibiosi TaxID=54550 RepID=A0ABR1F839_9ASCO